MKEEFPENSLTIKEKNNFVLIREIRG